ncbi:hypothetical protein Pyrde_1271 [Pyrodictium delaneyi]|uniref:Uncharacterized protein n=1 Tax=Pyrodictium delaneyi TaxID=1273541 RepID=A0A0P0N4F5_9CREN|nr:hypothetical protein [Pyrodictium delaneyi]ALL01317.1 hypothetical protein Pyrde_1271 [Pyrodictium delaneyi]OWJ53865.1 hypothetical protein Pdsh_10135 [Pyrodictium delaneyi]
MTQGADVINRFLKTVAEVEESIKRIEGELDKDTAALLSKADEAARKLTSDTEKMIEEFRSKLNEELKKELEKLEEEFKKREEYEVSRLKEQIERNRSQALEAAVSVLVKVIRG